MTREKWAKLKMGVRLNKHIYSVLKKKTANLLNKKMEKINQSRDKTSRLWLGSSSVQDTKGTTTGNQFQWPQC